MIHSIYHNYSDDELLRYALDTIQHPAVVEICQRLRLVDFELGDEDTVQDLQDKLDEASSQITCLEEEIEILKEDINDHLNHIESLEADLEEVNAIPN